ncbi:MAG: PH domain-containing protein [Bacteroidia bacterium]
MEFTLSRDKFSIIITSIVIAFALSGAIIFSYGDFNIEKKVHFAFLFSCYFILILCIVFYLYRPLKYSIENGNIRISRMLGDKIIYKDEIKAIRIPSEHDIAWPIRTFGNGGLFGYTGRYYTKHIGSMIWYCSRKNNFILIERKNKIPIVISPDKYKDFLKSFTA